MFQVVRNILSFGSFSTPSILKNISGTISGAPNLLKRLQAKTIMEIVAPKEGMQILDFGCGGGFFSIEMARRGARVIGADVITFPDYFSNQGVPLSFVSLHPPLPLPFPDNHFDVVLMSEVLIVLPEPISALKEISRVLKRDGKLVLANTLGRKSIEKEFGKPKSLLLKAFRLICGRNVLPKSYPAFCLKFLAEDNLDKRLWYSLEEILSMLGTSGYKSPSVSFPFRGISMEILYWYQFYKVALKGDLSIKFNIFFYIFFEIMNYFFPKTDFSSVVIIGEKQC